MGGIISRAVVGNQLEELQADLEQRSLQDVITQVQQELDLLDNTTLDIAITGESGAGKSSLVNAIRDMSDDEEGAAKTGVTQTTMDPHRYRHPKFPRIRIWDLPGIGTNEFEPEDYLEKVNFNQFDFFIIVAERFTVNHTKLSVEIQKINKKFYYVRTKVDLSMDAERRKLNFSENKTLEQIRNYCCENLKVIGQSSPRVFLISRWELDKYDFPLLQDSLEKELDDLKRHALVLAVPTFSREILKKKKAVLDSLIWKLSLTSGGVGATPIPGASLVCNAAMLVVYMKQFCMAFGLDEDSLSRLSRRVEKPVEVLKSAVKKSPMANEITSKYVIKRLSGSPVCATLTVLELALDVIPVVSSLAGGGLSFTATFLLLKNFLNDIEEDAENILAKAAEH